MGIRRATQVKLRTFNKGVLVQKPSLLFSILSLVLLFQPLLAEESKNLNWAVNGDFKGSGGWGGNITVQPGHGGMPAAYLENLKPAWTGFSQKIDLPQPVPPALEISGWLKIENVVKGQQEWEVARISVVFYDAKGNRVVDWPAPIASIQGTRDWALYDNQYSPPKDTAWATLEISLGNCTGRAWF